LQNLSDGFHAVNCSAVRYQAGLSAFSLRPDALPGLQIGRHADEQRGLHRYTRACLQVRVPRLVVPEACTTIRMRLPSHDPRFQHRATADNDPELSWTMNISCTSASRSARMAVAAKPLGPSKVLQGWRGASCLHAKRTCMGCKTPCDRFETSEVAAKTISRVQRGMA
jgi:hypothetical protein